MHEKACGWQHCKRSPKHYTLGGPLGKSRLVAVCAWHFWFLNAVTRIRFWRRKRLPSIETMRVGEDILVDAAYDPNGNRIIVMPRFADNEQEKMVYILAHETVHWILNREFGLLTSLCFDILYKRPLHCLGHHSLMTYELNLLLRPNL